MYQDKDDELDKDDKMDKDDEDNKEEEDLDKKEEEEEFFFSKILKMTQYTSLPNLVRLGQWEQVSEYILLHNTTSTSTTGENRARRTTSSPTQLWRGLQSGFHFADKFHFFKYQI